MEDKSLYGVVMDWGIPLPEFRNSVKQMIKSCRERNKVITLPLEINPGPQFLYQMACLLEQVNCKKCDAVCCSKDLSMDQRGIYLVKSELDRLAKYHPRTRTDADGRTFITFPCKFLQKPGWPDGPRCGIYKDRPFPCIIFPVQPGGFLDSKEAIAISSECPEGRRIALNLYLTAWHIRNSLGKFTENDLETLFNMEVER